MILTYPTKYTNASVCCQNQNAHAYIKHCSFLFKSNENSFEKGRSFMQMYTNKLTPANKVE